MILDKQYMRGLNPYQKTVAETYLNNIKSISKEIDGIIDEQKRDKYFKNVDIKIIKL